MSSFVGHGLTAIVLSLHNAKQCSTRRLFFWGWSLWLLVVSWGPDIDYIWPMIHPSAHNGLRISHSLFASCLLPGITGLWLWRQPRLPIPKAWLLLQVAIASFSHILLDILVGITPLPLLYPFSVDTVRLSFGILPSAGKIDVTNYYFWRNLYLELGVLVPMFGVLGLSRWQPSEHFNKLVSTVKWGSITLGLSISSAFMYQCYWLPRP